MSNLPVGITKLKNLTCLVRPRLPALLGGGWVDVGWLMGHRMQWWQLIQYPP